MNTTRTPMSPTRRAALIAGVAYILTFVGSIPALPLYDKILNDPNHLFGSASDAGVRFAALGELVCALTGIVTAVALYPIAKRHSERAAMGFVTSRVLEAAMILVGVLSVLSLVTLHDAVGSGGDATGVGATREALIAVHDWTRVLGPNVAAVINVLCIGTVMYRTRLIPRIIPTIGLIGAPILAASIIAMLSGAWSPTSDTAVLFALPIAVWEFSFGVYMTVKGFRSDAVIDLSDNAMSSPTVAPAFA